MSVFFSVIPQKAFFTLFFPPKGIGVRKYSKSILFKVETGISPTPNLTKLGVTRKYFAHYQPPNTNSMSVLSQLFNFYF